MKQMVKGGLNLFLCIVVFAVSAGADAQNLKFAVISDVRVEALDRVLEFIETQDVEFIILPGDF